MNKLSYIFLITFIWTVQTSGQEKSLVNTSESPHARLFAPDMDDVTWTAGFWAERFETCKNTMVPHMWRIYNDPDISHAFRNFEIAAGLETGSHEGPSFHDGDFYKTLEAVASMYAMTKDPELDQWMDKAIAVIAKSQREDGYIYTKAMIEQRKTGVKKQFEDRLSFEAYNIGHLMTAACVHYRATGKTSLLDVARKAGDYLIEFYKRSSPTLARNAICPSHYMGVVELYRTVKDPRYLELAEHLIDIKGQIDDGTDHNQDRIPFRQQTKATGHAVRANYLYAGAADVYAETGDTTLMNALDLIWKDVVQRKMYITGACGALYDGVSPDGTSYNPEEIQQIHQAYGREYQLPNFTAHNETCANIGNVLWNWRMLQVTGEARYADVLELSLYNSVLSGISLDGNGYLYANPLAFSDTLPFEMRWSKQRQEYISRSNCCPPNAVRTMAEVNNYAYSISGEGVWFNLYGSNRLSTTLENGAALKLTQETVYPWDGHIRIRLEEVPEKAFSLFLRVPGWCKEASLSVNGQARSMKLIPGEYAELTDNWSAGDEIELVLSMPVTFVESHPLVEETRNQVAVKRGPVVYCLESPDLPEGRSIFDVALPLEAGFSPRPLSIGEHKVVALEGEARLTGSTGWENRLYREIPADSDMSETIPVKLIPYYAWGNRGHSDMSVWLPLYR